MKSEASMVRLLAAVEWPKTVSIMCAVAHSSRPALDHNHTGRSRVGKSRARQMQAMAASMGMAAVRYRDVAIGFGPPTTRASACTHTIVHIA